MEGKAKLQVRLRLAACLRNILAANKALAQQNKDRGVEDTTLVASLRELEAASGLSYAIIQGVMSAKRDIQFASLIVLVEDGLNVSFPAFAAQYDAITADDIRAVKKDIETSRKQFTRRKVQQPKKGAKKRK